MGLNISDNKYVACIDVDCLLRCTTKMIKPFLESTDKKKVAAGGGLSELLLVHYQRWQTTRCKFS
jgi:hypothetical protein